MQRPRHQFLTAARRPHDQHRRRAGRNQLRQSVDALHRFAPPDHAGQRVISTFFISISISYIFSGFPASPRATFLLRHPWDWQKLVLLLLLLRLSQIVGLGMRRRSPAKPPEFQETAVE